MVGYPFYQQEGNITGMPSISADDIHRAQKL